MAPPIGKNYALPLFLLAVMFILMMASSGNDAAIIDELAHIPAGFGYVFLRDARLNPEHPPLIKDIAALPLAFTPLNFPTDVKSWRDDVNGQWDQGRIFLYEAGNDPDRILRGMRLAMMILTVVFGWFLWQWTRKYFGPAVASLTIFLYAFSPTFLAHGRFVTTDVGAALAFFIGITAFLRFLASPSKKNIVLAGLAFGLAQLLKFSLILLLPVYAVLLVAWAASHIEYSSSERVRLFFSLLTKTVLIGLIGLLLIWAVYAYHVWNYPQERQFRDAQHILTSFRFRSWIAFDLWLIEHPLLRPLGQYFLGLFMVLQRSAGGNTQYFLGTISAAGSRIYFPVLYLFKEPLTLHLLSLLALFLALRRVRQGVQKSFASILLWVRDHFVQFAALAFIALYWASSIASTLNIGVRHVLPTFPFIYVLVAKEITAWFRTWREVDSDSWWDRLKNVFQIYVAALPRYILVGVLLLWQTMSILAAFPAYLSYFNELGGGVDDGWRIAVDSNYDWGQDLKRLALFVETNGIQKVAVDYFGGGNPQYYLGEQFEPWYSARGRPPDGGWFAVSATFQMGAYGNPIRNFQRRPEDSYEWLKPFRPVARAGTSIFIYQLPESPKNLDL